jgi:FAD/FMN-containing dehydrogenase
MRGLTLSLRRGDPCALALVGIASLKIQAGERMANIYKFAAKRNLTVVGRAEPNVSIGGWIAHGGRGPVSAYYGLGADQVLEMEVVTADGVLRTVNETSEADLFWALRGVRNIRSERYTSGIADSRAGRREQFRCYHLGDRKG